MRDWTSSSEDTGLGAELLLLEGVGELVRYDRWFVFPNLVVQASGDSGDSGDGRVAERDVEE